MKFCIASFGKISSGQTEAGRKSATGKDSFGKRNLLFIAIVLFFLAIIPYFAYAAEDIVLTLNQTDYYFRTGENAVIPLKVENPREDQVNGVLIYTITQEISQGNFHYSSSNTESQPFAVHPGNQDTMLNFGTSQNPLMLKVALSFNYDGRTASLGEVRIHYVDDPSQQNQENQQGQESTTQQNSQQGQQSAHEEMERQVQEMIDRMNQAANPFTRQQNAIMPQDSGALKQEMQKQVQEQQRMKESLAEEIGKNEDFQKMNEELQQQGYKPESASFKPENNDTGSFEVNYKKENGDTAKISGSMENGEMKELTKESDSDKREMMAALQNNTEFKQMNETLSQQGFRLNTTSFEQKGNFSQAKLEYANDKNMTAEINAEFENRNVTKLELETEKENKSFLWFILAVPALILGVYLLSRRKKPVSGELPPVPEKPFDYASEAKKLLKEANKQFDNGHEKDAYGTAAQAVRMYLSYKNGLRKEVTNEEIVRFLKANKMDYKEAKECFNLCTLVEFAKYRANREDFDKIVGIAERVVK